MTDIGSAVATAMDKLVASGKIEASIEAALESTIAGLIQDQLRSYSEFGKALSAHIKKSIGVNLDHITLPEYNAIIADMVVRKTNEFIREQGMAELESTLKEMLRPAPETMKFSELVEDFKQFAVDHYEYDSESDQEVTIIVEDPSRWGSQWISLDRKPNKKKYDCEFSFHVSDHDKRVSSIRMRGNDPKKDIFIGGFYAFERTLFQLHVAKTKLIMDPYDTYLPDPQD